MVGAGKVGVTLARLLAARSYVIETVYSRTYAHADALAQAVNAVAVEAARDLRGDLLLLTVPDDAIRATAERLEGFNGRAVVHTSGAHDANLLAALAARGIQVGSLHPAYPFASVERAMAGLPGASFAVEAEAEPLQGWLRGIVGALNGQVISVPPGEKALYHAALTLLSNYTVTLYALAERLLLGLGADEAAAVKALNSLLAGTAENLRAKGTPNALTGPLVRGDVETIEAHLLALRATEPAIADVYRGLARLTLPLAAERGTVQSALEAIETLLG